LRGAGAASERATRTAPSAQRAVPPDADDDDDAPVVASAPAPSDWTTERPKPAVERGPEVKPAPAAQPDVLASALRHSPSGAPDVRINIVQWSAVPERRFAYVRVDGGDMTQVHEGDQIGGLTVKQIFQQAIEFAQGSTSFVLRTN
jgi:hypothetical protein